MSSTDAAVLPSLIAGVEDVDFGTDGILTRTSAGNYASRTITGTANQVVIANGDGVAGNPTLSLPQSIAAASAPTFAGMTLTAPLKNKLEIIVPTEGSTATPAVTTQTLILEPGGALTAVTVNFPASPANGQIFTICGSGGAIVGLTMSAGAGSIVGALTALAVAAFGTFVYRTSNQTWYRIG